MQIRSTLLGLALLGCAGPSHDTKVENTAKPAPLTLHSDDEFIANGREIVRRLVVIFTDDGWDCDKLAADVSNLAEDPIWPASTQYEDAHPTVRDRFATEQAQMGQRFMAVAGPAMSTCGDNHAFAAALAKMQ
ncbi:MAG TPA: hypothetical protein VGG28_23845 [Kofleriaceae bacterium]|jgi:hypothetical protein